MRKSDEERGDPRAFRAQNPPNPLPKEIRTALAALGLHGLGLDGTRASAIAAKETDLHEAIDPIQRAESFRFECVI